MKNLGMGCVAVLLFMGVFATNLRANPMVSMCQSEWQHFVDPSCSYLFGYGEVYFGDVRQKKIRAWMKENCPYWPDVQDPLYWTLYLHAFPYDELDSEALDLWYENPDRNNYEFKTHEEFEQAREKYYLAVQKEKYGRNIPYCLTQEAQNRFQKEKQETEKYLAETKKNPLVRDRLALLAKIDEANAQTAQEQGLENLYKPLGLKTDKATLDAWWQETHPNGKTMDTKSLQKRYNDYFEQAQVPGGWDDLKKKLEQTKKGNISDAGTINFRQVDSQEKRENLELSHTKSIKNKQLHYLLLTGFISLGIVAGAAIVLLRRKKNLPK